MPTVSEGASFIQKGRNPKGGKGNNNAYDKQYWANKTCHECVKKGHPKHACPKRKQDKAKLAGYHLKVWFNTKAITNILSLANVKKQYRVTCDLQNANRDFIVHQYEHGMPNMHFHMQPTGLHVYYPTTNEMTLLKTVSRNMEGYTKSQVTRAILAKELYGKLAYPSTKDFEWAIISNQIKDCPVSKADIQTEQQFGTRI